MGDLPPLTDREFAAAMAPLGPFERPPRVAVASSGGADSLALTLLADRWARAAGGEIVALTVDHGMRPEAAQEARRLGAWLAARDIDHRILRRRGAPPERNRQAAARALRYELLSDWCRRHGVPHLLLGHHLEDQGETLLLRLERGSGSEGLAAMAARAHRAEMRLLRPLLTVPKARLAALLRAAGQEWIEDPSNRDRAYARVRLRQALANEDRDAGRLAEEAREMGRARATLDRATARLLARAVECHPAGFARLDPKELAAAAPEVARRALSRVLRTIGGGPYGPRSDALGRLYAALVGGALARGRTLAGCRLVPTRGRVLVCREPAAAGETIVLMGPGAVEALWDGRFRLRLTISRGGAARLSRLGREGWAELVAAAPEARGTTIPAPARPALPALRDGTGLLAVPHLHFARPGGPIERLDAAFRPQLPLLGASFTVA